MGRGMYGVSLYFLLTPFLFFLSSIFSSVKEDPIVTARNTLVSNNTVHTVLFCPDEGKLIETMLIGLIRSSTKISGALYLLTQKNIIQELSDAKRRGAEVNLIFDPGAFSYQQIYTLVDAGIPLKVWNEQQVQKGFAALMHLKALIFCGAFSEDRTIVASGSMNLTQNGFFKNYDQVTFCDNQHIVSKYKMHIATLLENSRVQMQPINQDAKRVVVQDLKFEVEKINKPKTVRKISTKKRTEDIKICAVRTIVRNFSHYRQVVRRVLHH